MLPLFFVLGVFCSLQNGFAIPTSTPGGINYTYKAPPVISDTDIFQAQLEPTEGTNVEVRDFMYHFKHEMYASTFLTEIFTLGIHTHLLTNDTIDYPSDEERRIAIVIGKLWTKLENMRTINRIALRVSNETAHYYLRGENASATLRYAFSQLKDAAIADPMLIKAFVEEKKNVDTVTLPPLFYVNINLKKFVAIDKMLVKLVWPDPKSYPLIAHARFSQYVETKITNYEGADYENLLLAHQLVNASTVPELKTQVQKAYDEAIADAVQKSSQFLNVTRVYGEFDRVLFNSLNIAVKLNSTSLEESLMKMKSANSSAPRP